MKIVQISKECSSNGGVGTYVCNLISALESAGPDVSIIHSDLNADCSLKRTHQFYIKNFDRYAPKKLSEQSATLVMKILKGIDPDIVHVQGCNNFYLESEIRRKFYAIKTLHAYDFCPSGNKFHHASQKICVHPTGALCVPRMIFKRCLSSKRPNVIWNYYRRAVKANKNNSEYKKLIVASEYVKMQAIASGYPADQIEVIPYYTKLPSINPVSGLSENKILFIGRIVPEKGLKKLLIAFSQLQTSAQLIIAGDGGDLSKIKTFSRKLGIANKVCFSGWAEADQKDEFYRNASVVVIPSVWPEPFGIVGIEAMSYARPVVAFQTGGVAEWLEDRKTGFLIPAYDVSEMSKKIDLLLQQKELTIQMGVLGRAKVEQQFSESHHIQQLLDLYQNVINSKELIGIERERLYS
jgi:glycosyltransferase involved in cell wall biosynthesis